MTSLIQKQYRVAPLVGAWIEMIRLSIKESTACVAPLVGAWIEIMKSALGGIICTVAPLVGAWIEICLTHKEKRSLVSLPSWERGLKYFVHLTLFCCSASLPSWERGLKFTIVTIVVRFSRRSPRGSVD